MGIVRNYIGRISPVVECLGDTLRENYQYYQNNVDRSLLNSLKEDFHNMLSKSTPWIPASVAEYIVQQYIHENSDAEELIVDCVDKSIDTGENYTRLEYLYMFCCIFPKVDEAAANSLFTNYFKGAV